MTKYLDNKKLRGGYYTPPDVADWLAKWAIQSGSDRILEPSCGDGVFLAAAAKMLRKYRKTTGGTVRGVEISTVEAEKARNRVSAAPSVTVEVADFFEWVQANPDLRFDAVVGNPPFIRYQNFPEPSRSTAMSLMESLGLRPNKLTNIWVPFVAVTTSMLRDGGRLAMVLPAELLQVSYAAQLRAYLVDHFRQVKIMACNETIFSGAEQEVVLVLADDRVADPSSQHTCRIDLDESRTVSKLLATAPTAGGNGRAKSVRHDSEKWLKYFLTPREISFMRRLRADGIAEPLCSFAEVDVGVVTGKNSFFVLSPSQANLYAVRANTIPLLGRSAQMRGAVIDSEELSSLEEDDDRVLLFHVPENSNGDLSAAAKAYIAFGEKEGVNKGYKCRIRKKWYSVPSVWTPDCFLFRQIYDFPRVVINRTQATSTDTIHRMRCSTDAELLTRNLYTHLTGASSEIEGRSYGGGVLELEPTEAERVLVPRVLTDEALDLAEIDGMVRAGRLEDALAANDQRILVDGMGLSKGDCSLLMRIWKKMRDRRMSRRKSATRK